MRVTSTVVVLSSLFVAGAVTAFFAKMWFIDRMVWLFDDMAREHPAYADWLR